MGGALRELNSLSKSKSFLGLTVLVSTFFQLYEFGERSVEKTMMVRPRSSTSKLLDVLLCFLTDPLFEPFSC